MKRFRRLLLLAVFVIIPPLLLVTFASHQAWIKSRWEWITTLLALTGGWAASIWTIKDLYDRWLKRVTDAAAAEVSADFPFECLDPSSLAARLSNLSRPDIPYTPRVPEGEFRRMETLLGSSGHLLILGRTGLGKTREALELICRIDRDNPEGTTVLLPTGPLDTPLSIPAHKLKRNVVLFLDNLPARYAEPYRVEDLQDPKDTEVSFHHRLESTARHFERYFGGNFRIIATAVGDPELKKRLRLHDPFWRRFRIYELPDLHPTMRIEFLTRVGRHLHMRIDPDAKELMAERSDGTFAGLILPLLKEKGKRGFKLQRRADIDVPTPRTGSEKYMSQ